MDKLVSELIVSENTDVDLYYIAVLDGLKCKTMQSFLKETGRVFKFPAYYGKNLKALNDCLNDLEWLDKPNYFLIIKKSSNLLINESKETRDYILTFLEGIARQWANVPNYEGEEIYRHKADF